MRIGIETKVDRGVKYTIDFSHHGEVTILARNLKTGRTKFGSYETSRYNFRDGYDLDDVLEIYRLTDEICEDLRDETRRIE